MGAFAAAYLAISNGNLILLSCTIVSNRKSRWTFTHCKRLSCSRRWEMTLTLQGTGREVFFGPDRWPPALDRRRSLPMRNRLRAPPTHLPRMLPILLGLLDTARHQLCLQSSLAGKVLPAVVEVFN